VIYQDPLAYLLGLEGAALLNSWYGDHDREFIEARIAEIRRLLDDEQLRDRGVLVEEVGADEAYRLEAPSYDANAGGGLFTLDEPIVAGWLDDREPGVALDAACGTGRFAAYLAGKGHRVIGVDTSPDMLEHARRRVPSGEFHLGRLESLPLPDNSVDVIVCALALVHVRDLQPVLAEFARVLRPGGDLVISDVHHELVAMGSAIMGVGPAGRPLISPTYRHRLGAYLRAALSVGLELRGCEEPGLAPTDGPVPEPTSDVGEWPVWPWSLMAYAPAATQAFVRHSLVLWHFRQPAGEGTDTPT
jgi:SAM-dependent methyltransferase